MKKYQILITGLLLLLSASCTDETERGEALHSGDFRVTASIEYTGVMSRVADRNDRTSFTKNDEILIGWNGSASYKYRYSGTNSTFAPDAAADRKLWTELLNTSSTVNVYAWYGTMSSNLPAVGASVSIPQDQTSESKLLSAICMAAHQSASSTTNTFDFTFHHLTARLFLSVDIVDPTVTQPDVMWATARINHVYANGTIATDASNAYQLSVPDDKAGTQSIRMKQSWSDQEVFHLDFECLLPPQTLGEGQNITITLANGKEYVCSISSGLTLAAGQKTTLKATLKAEENSTFEPKLTVIPNAANSAFSGNRLICAIKNPSTTELRYRVYDLQPDGSWGEGVPVYEDEQGVTEFPTDKYKKALYSCQGVDMFRDYAVVSCMKDNYSTYFIKKSKKTGKWYCANGEIQGWGYSVCISNEFLVSGNDIGSNHPPYSRSYIYPIDEDGNLGEVQDTPNGIAAYKCSIYGDVLATNNGIYTYNRNTGIWDKWAPYSGQHRVATDGKRVIMQNGNGTASVLIYNVEKKQAESWEGSTAQAATSKPVAIYGDYALAGLSTGITICRRNPETGKWKIVGSSGKFLDMMKHWDPSITITQINGENLSMKGTRAMIVDWRSGKSFFIENIDKMVEDYLANPY